MNRTRLLFLGAVLLLSSFQLMADSIKLGLNYPQTGRYKDQGLQQRLGAFLAVEEINNTGGIMGRPVELIIRNTTGDPERGAANTAELIDDEGVDMVFGGSSSAVTIASGKVARDRGRIYFGAQTSSNATTGSEGHTHMFREYPNAWMTASALGKYLKANFANDEYFYLTADYIWGWSTEESVRRFTNTENVQDHGRALTPFPDAFISDFSAALEQAAASDATVLVLVLFGDDMVRALRLVHEMGLKERMQIVVPNITLGMAKKVGATIMEGVIATTPWEWMIPYQFDFARGQAFVESFSNQFDLRPSSTAATAYSIVYQYKDAVERAGTTRTDALIRELEGHSYSLLKDTQQWRDFDHQNLQTVYVVRSKPREQVVVDDMRSDFFEVVDSIGGLEAAQTLEQWQQERRAANKPLTLQ
ncbi:MAG: ABC transporter substrate-binding protein [Pseudomonadales bacterium]|nr:ABC transporter substrate-binding protein [Pseudomonadales bacterium]